MTDTIIVAFMLSVLALYTEQQIEPIEPAAMTDTIIVAFMLSVLALYTEQQIEPIEPAQRHHRTYTEFHRTSRTVVYYIGSSFQTFLRL
jgi:hypothetical protein